MHNDQLVDDIWTATHQIRRRTNENFNYETLKAFERKLACRRTLFDTPFFIDFSIADDPICVKVWGQLKCNVSKFRLWPTNQAYTKPGQKTHKISKNGKKQSSLWSGKRKMVDKKYLVDKKQR